MPAGDRIFRCSLNYSAFFAPNKKREQGYKPSLSSMAEYVVIIFRFLFPLGGRLLEYMTVEGES
jgi:hypothetical protein